MSIRVMSAVWDRDDLDPYERLVLLALADHADDAGTCYPSIGRLTQRTGMTDRGVQKVILRLSDRGFVSVEVASGPAGCNRYRVHPPEPGSPPNPVHPEPRSPAPRTRFTTPPNPVPFTPEPGSPEPSGTVIEPSRNRQTRKRASGSSTVRDILCEVVSPETADAFIEHRKAKRAKITDNAARLIANQLRGLPTADEAMLTSIRNGWTGVFPESVPRPSAGGTATQGAPPRTDLARIMALAAEKEAEAERERAARNARRTA